MKKLVTLVVWSLSLVACTEEMASTGDGGLEVTGTWTGAFGDEVITSASWSFMEVVSFDNTTNVAITQNPSDDMFYPDAYNKVVWTEPQGEIFHYCIVAFGQDSAEAAAKQPDVAARNDLDGEGCGGFPWTRLERK